MKRGLPQLLIIMIGIIAITVGAGFALGTPASPADMVAVLKAGGMTCGSCAAKVETALKAEPGVNEVQVDVPRGMVLVAYNSKAIKPGDLAAKVTATGYSSTVSTVLTMEQFEAVAGGNAGAGKSAGGCGDCCNKKKQ